MVVVLGKDDETLAPRAEEVTTGVDVADTVEVLVEMDVVLDVPVVEAAPLPLASN